MDVFKNVIGYEAVKAELERIVDILNNSEKYEKLGVKIPAGIMLVGIPGTGKTTMCNCILDAVNRNKYIIRKNKADGEFVKEITDTFKTAKENQPSIIFLDDIDKFSDNDRDHQNTDEFATLQSCIDEVKKEDVFIIATANGLRNIPSSLKRTGRFDKIIDIDTPTLKEAEKIISYYLKDKPNVSKDVDVKEIARILEGSSCSTLETIINEAGIYAAYEGKNIIEMSDIVRACLRIIYNAPESYENKSPEILKIAAVHECGHAVVAEVLEQGSVNLISIGNYLGDVGGITSITRNEAYFSSKECMENRIISLLAGKAATEIILGIQDTGANSDIHRAFDVVERFVDHYCLYGFDKFQEEWTSSEVSKRKEYTLAIKLEDYYQKAKNIIFKNKDFLENLRLALIEKTYLTQSDIKEARKKSTIVY